MCESADSTIFTYISDLSKTQKMYEKAVHYQSHEVEHVPDCYQFHYQSHEVEHVPNCYMTEKICEEAFYTYPSALMHVSNFL